MRNKKRHCSLCGEDFFKWKPYMGHLNQCLRERDARRKVMLAEESLCVNPAVPCVKIDATINTD